MKNLIKVKTLEVRFETYFCFAPELSSGGVSKRLNFLVGALNVSIGGSYLFEVRENAAMEGVPSIGSLVVFFGVCDHVVQAFLLKIKGFNSDGLMRCYVFF